MNMNETLTLAAWMLAPAFFSLLGMGAFGSPVIALFGELAAKTKKRVFYEKYGQQTATMGLFLLILMLVVSGSANVAAYIKLPQLYEKVLAPSSPLLIALYGFGAFIILSLIYFLTWKKMRNAKGLHIVLGLVSAIAAVACIVVSVAAKLTIGFSLENFPQLDIETIAMLWPMVTMYAILILSAAAALSCVYLIARRNRDDFGRDYYSFSLKLAARWSAIPMFGFLACQGWLYTVMPTSIRTMILGTPLALVWGAATALGILCFLLWVVIARSQSPLQFKGLAVLGIIFFWLMHTLNSVLFINVMSML